MEGLLHDQYTSLRHHVEGAAFFPGDEAGRSRRDCNSLETANIDLAASSSSPSRACTSVGEASTPAYPAEEGGETGGVGGAAVLIAASTKASSTSSSPAADEEEVQPDAVRSRGESPVSLAASLQQKEGAPLPSMPPESNPTPRNGAKTPASQRKPPRASVSRTLLSTATPTKNEKAKATVPAAKRITELLNGICGAAEKAQGTGPLPPLHTLDLPLGLLLLYCAAEDQCAAVEGADSVPASSSSSYSLLYQLEQISDLRCRDRRRAARARASATEEAKCSELFAAATRRQNAMAAQMAARAEAVAAEELGPCTFHPYVSPAARAVTGKGTTDFMAKCLEWKEKAECRLRVKYERQAQVAAEEAAAAAAQRGVAVPGDAATQYSRRLMENPAVQERMKARPSLWEARKPVAAETIAGTSFYQPGVPAGSKVVAEQEAVLRTLRRRGDVGQEHASFSRSSAASSAAVRRFLGRVEEDAKRRETTAVLLQSRYHNPESERFEAATGQPLFAPNAMPTVVKDGRRVGYEVLSKDEQRDLRAELRKANLDFLVARHNRDAAEESADRARGDVAEGEQSGAAALTADQQARFLASLQETLARREKNLERLREQATVEETFHPHITPRTVVLARHKIGNKPIYERSTAARDAAAVPPKPALREAATEGSRSRHASQLTRPLPPTTEVFLARSEQWTDARQRRYERLVAMEEEKLLGECTFTPKRTFYDPEYAHLHGGGAAAEGSAPPLGFLDTAREGSEPARHRSAHMRHQDEMATAADVRLMNELELLRSGAAFRNEHFVQAVCEQSGLADRRQAMANLSLLSAPRLSGSRPGLSPAGKHSHRHHRHDNTSSTLRSPSRRISPIIQRSNRRSASPYAPLHHLDSYGEAPPQSVYESRRTVPMMRTESGATQIPARRDSHARDVNGASQQPSVGRPSGLGTLSELPPVEDPWAALDAQTDAILKRHGY